MIRRKLTLQLTPLLDMLLIVIFAQYIDVRDNEAALTTRAAATETDLSAARDEAARLRAALGEASRLLDDAEVAMLNSRDLIVRQREERERAAQQLDQAVERQRILGRLMVDLFDIPQATVDNLLDPHRDPPLSGSSEELERLGAEFRRMAQATPGEMVKHLLTYDEIRKRADIWELHLAADPRQMVLDEGGREHPLALRLESEQPLAGLDATRFEQDLFDLLKSLPQPKGLVIVLLTYDADVRNNVVDPARAAVRHVLDRLRADSSGRSQFEFADLGIALP